MEVAEGVVTAAGRAQIVDESCRFARRGRAAEDALRVGDGEGGRCLVAQPDGQRAQSAAQSHRHRHPVPGGQREPVVVAAAEFPGRGWGRQLPVGDEEGADQHQLTRGQPEEKPGEGGCQQEKGGDGEEEEAAWSQLHGSKL